MVQEEFGDQLIVADCHVSDVFEVPWTAQKGNFYGVSGIPHTRIDGKYSVIGASSCPGAAAAFRNYINQRLNETGGVSPVSIDGFFAYNEATLTMTATFELEDPVTLVSPKAQLLVLEDGILYSGDTYNYVVRAGYSESITLENVGDQVVVTHEFTIDPLWNMDNVHCFAFLQKYSGDKEIYQGGRLPLVADFSGAFVPPVASVPEGNGTATLEGFVTNISEATDNLTISLYNTFGWDEVFKVEGDSDFHTDPSLATLAPGDTIKVWIRVTTDSDVRIGTGGILVYSENSDREQPFVARVFNGSPAIMVVDDDDVNDDEVLILNALDAANLLYTHWDVYGRGGRTPGYEDLGGYDVLLWHTGRESYDLLTEEDMETVMAFMDDGRGFILSSQDFLSGVDPGTFTQDYLGVESWVEQCDADAATGVDGDPITDGMAFDLTYPHWSVERPDDVTPNEIGTVILHSEENENIAVRADNGTARSVFFAYYLNAMSETEPDPNNPKTLLARAVAWVQPSGTQAVDDPFAPSVASMIRSVEPNPIHGGDVATLTLRITDAGASGISLDVMDINGRRIANLFDGPAGRGTLRLTWDGTDAGGKPVGAGVYYFRLTTTEGTSGTKVVVLK